MKTYIALALLGLSVEAHAAEVIFASYSPSSSEANIAWRNSGTNGISGTGGSLFTISTPGANAVSSTIVNFKYTIDALASIPSLVANATIQGSVPLGTPAVLEGGLLVQRGVAGSISFIAAEPFSFGGTNYNVGANLLSLTYFNAAVISGVLNSVDAKFSMSTLDGGTIIPSSDLFDFGGAGSKSFAFDIGQLTQPFFAQRNRALRNFAGVSGGTFSVELPQAAVPEPAMWATLIVGFAMVGGAARARKSSVAKVVA